MTVLCRMNGLPARYVEGYLAEPNSDGIAVVTGEKAHAWTEVYFKGFGWLTFDATPGNRRGPNDETETGHGDNSQTPDIPENAPEPSEKPTPSPTPTPEPEKQPDETPTNPPENPAAETTPTPPPRESTTPEPTDRKSDPAGTPENQNSGGETTDREYGEDPGTGFPWFLIPVLAVFLLVLRIIITSPSVKEHFSGSEEIRAGIWIQEIWDMMSAEHMERKKGETPLGFTERVDRTGFYSTALQPVGETISEIVYSRAGYSADATGLIRDTALTLKPEISKPGRARYWIRRIFMTAKQRDWKKQ